MKCIVATLKANQQLVRGTMLEQKLHVQSNLLYIFLLRCLIISGIIMMVLCTSGVNI